MFDLLFIMALFMFWLVMFERLFREQNQRKTELLSKGKLIFFSFYFLINFFIILFFDHNMENDPTYTTRDD